MRERRCLSFLAIIPFLRCSDRQVRPAGSHKMLLLDHFLTSLQPTMSDPEASISRKLAEM